VPTPQVPLTSLACDGHSSVFLSALGIAMDQVLSVFSCWGHYSRMHLPNDFLSLVLSSSGVHHTPKTATLVAVKLSFSCGRKPCSRKSAGSRSK